MTKRQMSGSHRAVLDKHIIEPAVVAALREDLGLLGDITTDATVPAHATATAILNSREGGVVAGITVAQAAFLAADASLDFHASVVDGETVTSGQELARVRGNARAILKGERVALNFLGRMSGIATLTDQFVTAVAGTNAAIIDTRKTTPGLRAFEKYAVRCGGGQNHRSGLFDAILIKDNHIVAAGGLDAAVESARAFAGHMVKIEVEVDTLEQLERVMAHKVDAVLLDNMTPDMLRQAVRFVDGRALTEASGGVNLVTAAEIAASGVDLISVGALTHSARNFDIGLDFIQD